MKQFLLSGFKLVLLIKLTLLTYLSYAQQFNPAHSIGTFTGSYHYTSTQTPELVQKQTPVIPSVGGTTYQWYSTTDLSNPFLPITGATSSNYVFSGTRPAFIYFYRITTVPSLGTITSNTIKIYFVSNYWDDHNYVREHEVIINGVTNGNTIEGLPIGDKLQTTQYVDGLGRKIQQVSRETATPPSGTLWGDVVQFNAYDALGREPKAYLPFTTTSLTGKFKTSTVTDQATYYTTNYNESSPFVQISFDGSPLNRITNTKKPGTSWAASVGNSATYETNTLAENVQKFTVNYTQGSTPVNNGAYPANTLYKSQFTDVNGKKVIEYLNTLGQLVLKKVQIDNSPGVAHTGWICTYYVYDEFGLLRYQIQPEAVKFLDANSWSFTVSGGSTVFAEWCFQYDYDDKGRMIWKKAPGAAPLNMIYDGRDRLVFMQDGNQAALNPTKQWTANLYDDLDRTLITTLFNTNKTITTLKNDIAASVSYQNYSLTNPAAPLLNLVVSTRQAGITLYEAAESVELVSNFESLAGDEFTVQINPAAVSSAVIVTVATYNSPISSIDLNTNCTVVKYNFYDSYLFAKVKSFDNSFTNETDGYTTGSSPNVIPIARSLRTTSLQTGSATRILGTTLFLYSSIYYDAKGRLIQHLDDNVKNGTDINTYQYHFDGRLLSECSKHTAPATGYSGYVVLTKNVHDKLGRVISIQKKFGSNGFVSISSVVYDDMGRVKTKILAPGYTANGGSNLESLNYSYNLHSQITGINKEYALKSSGYNKWNSFFGMYLGYDNRDNAFTRSELNGQVAGQLWSTLGDNAQRRYVYSYDNADRFIKADYTERALVGDTYGNAKMDFTVGGAGTTGGMTYDLNGNILSMQHKGVNPGSSSPLTIDNLQYVYNDYSNKLRKVTDQMTVTNLNGTFSDFKDGANGANPDYVYDENGNVIVDLNKGVQSVGGGAPGTRGIRYNYLDKPEEIRIPGKGTIYISYAATGEKVQRTFTNESGQTIKTTYINEFIYESRAGSSDNLSFIQFEDGRLRVVNPVNNVNTLDGYIVAGNVSLPNSKEGALDFYITDYQENVRMILTEEVNGLKSTCTMETDRNAYESAIFGQPNSNNEVVSTRVAKPVAWTSSTVGNSVSRLGTTAGFTLGPNTLQKVMAGDDITTSVDYYFQGTGTSTSSTFTNTLISTIGEVIIGGTAASAAVKGASTAITSQLGSNTAFLSAVQPGGAADARPKAFLTVLFFDERFNPIAVSDSGVVQIQINQTVPSAGAALAMNGIKAPRNGYMYAYVSNRSDQVVYFDNFQLSIVRGRILEENHYYAYGLKITAISSRKAGDENNGRLKNDYFYNGKELFEDADLNWYDYGFRNYDPQIGRFTQLDPLTDQFPFLTPYQYASCDPIDNIDIDGLEGGLSTTAETAKVLQRVVVQGVKKGASAANTWTRVWGVVKVIGAVAEIAGGAVFGAATSWTGVGIVAGGLIVLHGADQLSAALTQVVSGKETKSLTQQGISAGLQGVGVSKDAAEGIADGVDMGISVVGGAAGGALRLAPNALKTIVLPKTGSPRPPPKPTTPKLSAASSAGNAADEAIGGAAKNGQKLLNQFNSAESLIEGAGKLQRLKGAMQGFVKGNGNAIFNAITNGGKMSPKGYFTMPDGTIISKYLSSTTGEFTISINKAGEMFKIRITP